MALGGYTVKDSRGSTPSIPSRPVATGSNVHNVISSVLNQESYEYGSASVGSSTRRASDASMRKIRQKHAEQQAQQQARQQKLNALPQDDINAGASFGASDTAFDRAVMKSQQPNILNKIDDDRNLANEMANGREARAAVSSNVQSEINSVNALGGSSSPERIINRNRMNERLKINKVNNRNNGLDLKKFAGMSNDEVGGLMDEIGFSGEQKRLFHNMRNQYDTMMGGSVGQLSDINSTAAKYGRAKESVNAAQNAHYANNAALDTMTKKYINPNTGDFYEMTNAETRAKYNEIKNNASSTSTNVAAQNKERQALEEKMKNIGVLDKDRLAANAKEEVGSFMERRGTFLDSMGDDRGKIKTLMDRVGSHRPDTAGAGKSAAQTEEKIMKSVDLPGSGGKSGFKMGKVGKVAVGAAALYGLVQMMNSNRGQQENSSLYSPGGAMY